MDGTFPQVTDVYAGDIDGDGDLDILGSALSGYIIWWENAIGNGSTWTEHIVDNTFDGAYSVYAVDMNRDDHLDIIGAAANSNEITWWKNITGDGSSWNKQIIDGEFHSTRAIYAADVDGDSDMDVLATAFEDDEITWWENESIYEPNNSCEQANAIPSDGTIQNHNFHAQKDQDWLSFEASAGITYTIQARTPAGSLADLIMEVYQGCHTTIDPGQDPSFSPDVRLTFTAPTTGSYYLRLLNHDPDQYGPDVRYNVSVRRLDSVVNPGAVVVVAGRFFSNPVRDLQSNIQNVTNQVYKLFRAKNYPAERIHYLATSLNIDATGEGQPDVSALANKANLEKAITEWTADKGLGPERAFTLYLMDHGGENGTFYLDQPRGEQVTAQELDDWLDQLEADNPGVKVNIIIEACFSGGFLNGQSRRSGLQERDELLSTLGSANRVIITSTDAVALAYASPNGAWFSDSLLDALAQDMNLADAFDDARNSAQHANPAQEPFIDGNGIPTFDMNCFFVYHTIKGFSVNVKKNRT